MKPMTAKTRRAFGVAIRAENKRSRDADAEYYRLLEQYAVKACPLNPSDIVVLVELGQRKYFRVRDIDAHLSSTGRRDPVWVATCFRCTKQGERRPGYRRIRESDFTPEMLFRKAGA